MLKKYVPDKSHVLEQEPIEIHEDLSFEEKPVRILDYKIKTLRNKDILLVKVLWWNQETIKIHEDLTFEEKLVRILDYKIKTLRNKDISLVKILWRNQKTEEATWEREDEMRTSYPELF